MLAKEKLDAVAVCTPDFLHREITVEALDAGKHVLVQKPMDVTVEGCEAMLKAAEENGVLLEVDLHKRFDPPHRKLKEAIEAGCLGQIQYGYAWIEDRIEVPTEWLRSWASKSSPSWFVGIHYYDLFVWMLQSKPKRVYAQGWKGTLAHMGFDTFDSVQAMVEFENGANIVFVSSWILPDSFPSINNQGCRVIGTKGIWEIDAQDRGVWVSDERGTRTHNYYFLRDDLDPMGRTVHLGYGVDSHREFLMHVCAVMKGQKLDAEKTTLLNSAKEAIESTRIAVAIDESMARGEVVDL